LALEALPHLLDKFLTTRSHGRRQSLQDGEGAFAKRLDKYAVVAGKDGPQEGMDPIFLRRDQVNEFLVLESTSPQGDPCLLQRELREREMQCAGQRGDMGGVPRVVLVTRLSRQLPLVLHGSILDQAILVPFADQTGGYRHPEMRGSFHKEDQAVILVVLSESLQLLQQLLQTFQGMGDMTTRQDIALGVHHVVGVLVPGQIEAADQRSPRHDFLFSLGVLVFPS
jgi:hypothetical protein